jgi:hypothetical protein
MNPFVNPNKRGVELPKGYKNLGDVLRAKKCVYCDDAAVATRGWPGDYRWCEACQRDLAEFAKIEVPKGMLVDGCDQAAVSQYRTEMQRREEDFMRQKVKERKPR